MPVSAVSLSIVGVGTPTLVEVRSVECGREVGAFGVGGIGYMHVGSLTILTCRTRVTVGTIRTDSRDAIRCRTLAVAIGYHRTCPEVFAW